MRAYRARSVRAYRARSVWTCTVYIDISKLEGEVNLCINYTHRWFSCKGSVIIIVRPKLTLILFPLKSIRVYVVQF